MNFENIKKVINSPATLSFLLLIQIILHLFYFKIQEFDLPNSTKKLVIDTIKNEISFNPKCVNENCKKEVKNLENVLDEISYANQLGRLDTISLLLTLFGIVIGFGAVFGFLHIKESSENVAKNAAEKWLDNNSEKILKNYANKIEAGGFLSEKLNPLKEAKKEAKKDIKSAKSDDEKYEDL
jgi:hypothetical protein